MTVETDEPVPVELDGEQPGTTPARFEVLPGRVAAQGAGGIAPGARASG